MGLLDRLLEIAPPSLTRFFFANSGSEAVDNAIKVARGHTKRQNIICFEVRRRCAPVGFSCLAERLALVLTHALPFKACYPF